MEKGKQRIIGILIIVLLGVVFWSINNTLPFVMDDELYAHIYPEKQIENGNPHCLDAAYKINSISDVFHSQWNHYFTKNGRGLTHIFVQIFCGLLGKPIYSIIAGIIFSLFVLFLPKLFCPWIERPISSLYFFFPLLLFFLLIPEPTSLWNGIAYGINYLWASTWILLFSYIVIERDTSQTPNRWLILVGCIVAVLAGWSHEGLVIPLGAALLWYACQRKLQLNSYEWILFSLFAIAAMLLVFAPSNFSRAESMNESDWAGGVLMLRLRVFRFVRGFYVFVITALLLFYKKKDRFIDFVNDNQCWLFGWVVAVSFIMFVGALNDRSTFGIDFFSVLLLCRVIGYFDISAEKIKPLVICSSVIFLVGLGNVVYWQYKAGNQYREIDNYLELSQSQDALAVVEPVNVPYLFKRYVARYKFEEPWEDWEERVDRFKFNKSQILIAASSNPHHSLTLLDILDSSHKYPGSNPFYKVGNYLISIDTLPDSVSMKWILGDYQVYDILSLAKKCFAMLKTSSTYEMEVQLPVKHIYFQNQDIWIADMYPKQSREILEIEYNEGKK